MDIKQALQTLDHTNDDQWTADGLPRIDVVAEIVGVKGLKRKQITDAAPEFIRGAVDPGEDEVKQNAITENEPQEGQSEELLDNTDVTEKILGLTPAEATSSVDMMETYMQACTLKSNDLAQQLEEIKDQLKVIGFRQELVSVQYERHKRSGSRDQVDETQRYLRAQLKAKEDKVRRTRDFLDKGITAKDLMAELGGASPLDAALKARKAVAGQTRPAVGVPIQGKD